MEVFPQLGTEETTEQSPETPRSEQREVWERPLFILNSAFVVPRAGKEEWGCRLGTRNRELSCSAWSLNPSTFCSRAPRFKSNPLDIEGCREKVWPQAYLLLFQHTALLFFPPFTGF